MLTLNLSFKSLPFLSTQFESYELPISPLISFHSLSPYKFCVNSIPWCVFICYNHYLVIHRSYLDVYLISTFKISSFPSQSEHSILPTFPLVVSSSLSLASFQLHRRVLFFVTCKFLNLSFVVFLFVISFTLLITLSYLVITLRLLSKISNLLSQFESGVLLISPLAISSSSPRVSLDITPFFVVLIPLHHV